MSQCCRRRSLSDPSRKVWFSKTRLEGKINWKKPEKKSISKNAVLVERETQTQPTYYVIQRNLTVIFR